MRTRCISYKYAGSPLYAYFAENCHNSRAMRNTANFYIRNVMTGIRKAPSDRTPKEAEVLRIVEEGITKANAAKDAACAKKLSVLKRRGGMKSAVSAHAAAKSFRYHQMPTPDAWLLSYGTLDAIFKETENATYIRMPSQVNQNAIKKTCDAWKAYFKAHASWKKNSSLFKAEPRIPGYIHEDKTCAWWTNQTARLIFAGGKAYIAFVGCDARLCVGKESQFAGKYVKTEVKPYHGIFRVMVTMDDGAHLPKVPEHPTRIMGGDIGVTKLLTFANNFGASPFIVSGRWMKSMNRYFNKERARLVSELTRGLDSTKSVKSSRHLNALSRRREDMFRDRFCKMSHAVCRYAKAHHVEVIVIGHNEGQKQVAGMGRINNQTFAAIPYTKLLSILRNTAAKYGIPVVETEESYTSKASVVDGDPLPAFNADRKTEYTFSGKRVKRGLYRTKEGLLLNADVNGACNIIRKVYPEAFTGVTDWTYLSGHVDVLSEDELFMAPRTAGDARRGRHKAHRKGRNAAYRHHMRWKEKIRYMADFNAASAKKKPRQKQSAEAA